MKFIAQPNDLLSAIKLPVSVVGKKNNMPILDNIYFATFNGYAEIVTTNLEITVETRVKVKHEKDAEVLIPAVLFSQVLASLPNEPVTFQLDNTVLKISTGSGKFQIPVMLDVDSFPKLPEIKENKSITISGDRLRRAIKKTSFAVANDDIRPVMTGIFIEYSGGKLTATASDAHKLANITLEATGADTHFILPIQAATLIKNMSGERFTITDSNKNVYITDGNYSVIARKVEGEYPPYRNIIPANNKNTAVFDRATLIKAIKRVSVFASASSSLLKIKFDGNKATLITQDIDFSLSASETIPVSGENTESGFEIGLKSDYLLQILESCTGNDAYFFLGSDSTRAVIVKNGQGDEIFLQMPMLIS